jgi:hypothetical protein
MRQKKQTMIIACRDAGDAKAEIRDPSQAQDDGNFWNTLSRPCERNSPIPSDAISPFPERFIHRRLHRLDRELLQISAARRKHFHTCILRSPDRRIGWPEEEHTRRLDCRCNVGDATVMAEEKTATLQHRGENGQGEMLGDQDFAVP